MVTLNCAWHTQGILAQNLKSVHLPGVCAAIEEVWLQ